MRFLPIFLLPIVIFSYEWAPPQQVGNGVYGYSRFSLDCFDRLWCIFDSSCTVKVSRYLDTLWSTPLSVFSGPQASGVGGFDATRTKKGKLWVLTSNEYLPGAPPHLTIYYDGNIWSDTFVIPVSPIYNGTHFRLAADSIGKVWTVFDGWEDYHIWCDVCEDTVWYGPYVVCSYPTHDQVTGSNITVDPKGIRWAAATAVFTPSGHQIFLCRSDSIGWWSDSLIMGPTVSSGGLRDITSDNVGNIWIAWVDLIEDKIYTAYLDTNLNWSPYYQITQSSGSFVGSCNMAVDTGNKVWIVYDKGNNFYYRVWNGFEWSPEDSIVPPPASSSSNGAIFYDPIRNRIWISFKISNDIYTTWTDPSSGIKEHSMLDAKRLTPEIYPNPTKDAIRVRYPWASFTPNASRPTLKIFDVSGQLIKEIASPPKADRNDGIGEAKISLKGISPGIYFLRLGRETKKFLVVK